MNGKEKNNLKCPDCGADMLDWRNFNKIEIGGRVLYDFECTGFRCGKRWKLEEILQKQEEK